MKKLIHVVFNPGAGTAPTSERILQSFQRHGEVEATIDTLEFPKEMKSIVDDGLKKGADVIVAAGGDGTVSGVAGRLVNRPQAMGVLPVGTLNHLAKDLGIPSDLDQAVDVICSGKPTRMDIGEINGKFFVNNISLGFYVKAVSLRERLRPIFGKWAGLALAVVMVSIRMPFFRIILEWDERTRRILFLPFIFIGNNQYETSWPETGKRTILNKGVLWVVFLRNGRFWPAAKALWSALNGRIVSEADVEAFETDEISIRSHRHFIKVVIDGELEILRSPLKLKSHPGALNILAPNADS